MGTAATSTAVRATAKQTTLSKATGAPIVLPLCSESIAASQVPEVRYELILLPPAGMEAGVFCRASMCLKASPLGIGF